MSTNETPFPATNALFVVHSVLFEHTGENATSAATPIGPWLHQVDLTEKKTACAASDWDMPVEIARYRVRQVRLPVWLSVEEWIARGIRYSWMWGLGADPTWPEAWQRGLTDIDGEAQRYAVIQLLKVRSFRSDFRRSLRDQIVAWFETPREDRPYQSPLSPRQWSALIDVRDARNARNRSERLYWSHQYHETLGVPAAQ